MNKRLRNVLVVSLLVVILCACGQKQQSTEELEAQIADLQAQLDSQNSDTSESNKIAEATPIEDDTQDASNEETPQEIINLKYDESVETDFVQFSFDKISTAQEIKPKNPESVYRYIGDEDDQVYFYASGTLKNIGTKQFEFANSCFCKLVIDDKYEYPANLTADEGGTFSYIYSYLDPFQSAEFYITASVPDELANQYSKATFYFGFKENFDDGFALTEDECEYLYSISATK